MEIIKIIDMVLQTAIVRWALLVLVVALTAMLIWSEVVRKTLRVQLNIANAATAQYEASARVAEQQRLELEARVRQANRDIVRINKHYLERLNRITKIKPAPCPEQVSESLQQLQGGRE